MVTRWWWNASPHVYVLGGKRGRGKVDVTQFLLHQPLKVLSWKPHLADSVYISLHTQSYTGGGVVESFSHVILPEHKQDSILS